MKSPRHSAIRDLLVRTSVTNRPVTNQEELRRKLAAKGIHVTQATLSRDIRDLKLTKGPAGYALPSNGADAEDAPALARVLSDFGVEARVAQNLVVVLTIMGGAQPVAASLDSIAWPDIVGTVAGDNTVLIICPDNRKAAAVAARIEAYLV